MGDQFNLTGDFRGSIINFKSTLRNVHQTAGEIPNASEDDRKRLQDLIVSLTVELEKAPAAQKEEVEAVAITATTLVEQVKDGKKNKTLMRITAEGLKTAASSLAPMLPAILPIVTQMIATVAKMSGTG